MAKVKGILFTLGLTLFALLILVITTLIFNVFEDMKGIVNEELALDNLYELDVSIQKSFNKIVEKKSGINFEIKGKEIIINETLPNLNANSFKNETAEFKQFLDSKFSNAVLNNDLIEELPITVRPYDLVYKHNKYGDKKIIIQHKDNATAYTLYFFNKDINSTVEFNDFTPGNIDFTIIYESGSKDTKSHKIDPAQSSRANIRLESGSLDITINNNEIRIDNNSNINVVIKTTIEFINEIKKRLALADILILTFSEYNIIKRGDITLA